MSETQWPIYKGPIKVPFRKKDRLYPERIGRHGKVYEPKHQGGDIPYQLYLGHYEPKHKRRDYRYAKDGTIRKVLPRSAVSKTKNEEPLEKRNIPKGPQDPPPPRALLVHRWNDRYEPHFSLVEYRTKRQPLTWSERFSTFNYYREVCMVEGVLMIIGLILMIQETARWQMIGTTMMIILLIAFPLTAISAIVHHVKR